MAADTVMTVLGPVPAASLGATMAHEHVFFDLSAYYTQAPDDPDAVHANAPISTEELWWLRAHPMNNPRNLLQRDRELAAREVGFFGAAGGGTLVDVTTVGLDPDPEGLVLVSRQTGVHIVAGTGFYIESSLPSWVAETPIEQLAAYMRRELEEGIGGTSVRAGLIGELGVADPPSEAEDRVLRAAALVQRETNCAVSLHPYWGRDAALASTSYAMAAGINPARTTISHLDNRFRGDIAAYREVARRGFFLDLDCWGRDLYYPQYKTQLPSDHERMNAVLSLLDAGLEDRLLLAQDLCYTHELVTYGGYGYAHVMRTIQPRMADAGISERSVERMLRENPRRWLAGE
jgi:phosphotriesterase-related protein